LPGYGQKLFSIWRPSAILTFEDFWPGGYVIRRPIPSDFQFLVLCL